MTRRWTNTYSGGNQNDVGLLVKTSFNGEAYIGGNYKYTSVDPDVFLLRYSTDGGSTTNNHFDVSGNKDDFFSDMVIDASDNVYATGYTVISAYDQDWFLGKFNSSLTRQWLVTTDMGYGAVSKAIDADTSGHVYVTGYTLNHDVYVKVYSSTDGSISATLTYSKSGDAAVGISTGNHLIVKRSDRSVYLTGETPERITGSDWPRLFVAKFTYSGSSWSLAWSATYGWGSGEYEYRGRKVTYDTSGNVYVAGTYSTQTPNDSPDIILLKYNSSGTLVWDKRVDGDLTNVRDTLASMVVDHSGNLYLGGASKGLVLSSSDSWPDNADMSVWKFNLSTGFSFSTAPNFFPQQAKTLPLNIQLQQNYPNPFNPQTNIRFILSDEGVVTLKIYDIVGREIATLADNQYYTKGTHELNFNASQIASGVYFYRILTNDGKINEIKKMVLMK